MISKYLIRFCSFIVISILTTGCFSSRLTPSLIESSLTEKYVGQSSDVIISTWGAPIRTSPDGKGGTILVYEHNNFQKNSFISMPYVGTPDEDDEEEGLKGTYAQFFIDADGICYSVLTDLAYYKEEKVFSLGKTLGLVIPISSVAIINILSMIF